MERIARSHAWQDQQYGRVVHSSPVISTAGSSAGRAHNGYLLSQDFRTQRILDEGSINKGDLSSGLSPAYRGIPDYVPRHAMQPYRLVEHVDRVEDLGPPPMAHRSYVLTAGAEREKKERDIEAAAQDNGDIDRHRRASLAEQPLDSREHQMLRSELAHSEQRVQQLAESVREVHFDWEGMNNYLREIKSEHDDNESRIVGQWAGVGETLKAVSQGTAR